MTRPASCPRLFEVEARRDGRLGGTERASFERHLASCSACAREAQALGRLVESLRVDSDGGVGADELQTWRERTRLLAAFDRTLVAPEWTMTGRRWRLWPVTVGAVAAGLLIFWLARPGAVPAHPPVATIRADGATAWSKHVGVGNREEVALERGVLWIHVDHAPGGGRLLVSLPDGELEDIGTTFTVTAEGGHTTRVAVEEGRVVLRLRGRPAVDIGSGSIWLPEAPAASPEPVSPVPAPTPDSRSSQLPRALSPPRLHGRIAATRPDSLAEFRAAMVALRAGDDRQAAAAFTSFLVEHPGDPMAEDAAYLRVIALQRAGDASDMKQAAGEYLRRFPTGFRRAEIEGLSR